MANLTSATNEVLLQYIQDIESGKRTSYYKRDSMIGLIKSSLIALDKKQREEIKQILLKKEKTPSDARMILDIIREKKEELDQKKEIQRAEDKLVTDLYKSNFLAGLVGSVFTEFTRSMEKSREAREDEEELARELNRKERPKEKERKPERIKPSVPTPTSPETEKETVPTPLKENVAIIDQLIIINSSIRELIDMKKVQMERFRKIREDEIAAESEKRQEKRAKKVDRNTDKQKFTRENPEAGGVGFIPFAGALGAIKLLPLLTAALKKIFLPAAIAFAAYEFFSGFSNAKGILSKSDITFGDKVKAGIANSVSGILLGLFEPSVVADMFDNITSFLKNGFDVMITPFKNTFESVKTTIDKFIEQLDSIKKPIENFIDTLLSFPSEMIKKVPESVNSIIDTVKEKVMDFFPTPTEVPEPIKKNKIEEKKEELKKKVGVTPEPERRGPRREDLFAPTRVAPIDNKTLENYLKVLAMMESSGDPLAKAKTSTASGMFQFIESTWDKLVASMGKEYSKEDRFDPKKATEVAKTFTSKNMEMLKRKFPERDISYTDLYMMHFLGETGGTNILRMMERDPSASAADLLPKAAEANKSIFFDKTGKSKTVQEVYKTFENKIQKLDDQIKFGNVPKTVQEISTQEPLASSIQTKPVVPVNPNNTKGYQMLQKSSENYANGIETTRAVNNAVINNIVNSGGGNSQEVGSGHKGVANSRSTASSYLRAIQNDFVTV